MAVVHSRVLKKSGRGQAKRSVYALLLVCAVVLGVSTILCVGPLQNTYPAPLPLTNPFSVLLSTTSEWCFHVLMGNQLTAAMTAWASNTLFFTAIGLFCLVYGLAGWYTWRKVPERALESVVHLVWWSALVIGLLFVFMPAMLSKDLFVYADYGHILAVYKANPYFVVPGQISRDPITVIDGWRSVFSAYGPLWMYVCAFISVLTGDGVVQSFFAYRIVGLLCHLCSIVLVVKSLRMAGRDARAIALGALLYGWNPLALLEGSMGGHNDIFMSMLLLLATYLALRAEKRGFTHMQSYLPPLVVLTLATLVKFTTLPLIVFFIVLLLRKSIEDRKQVVINFVVSCSVFVAVCAVLYLPLWWGHSVGEIVHSFGTPPSSVYAENSLMRAVVEWLKVYDQPMHTTWPFTFWQVLAQRATWNVITEVALGVVCLYGIYRLWRAPSVALFAMASLAAMTVLLIVTPWFFSWYVVWLVALVAIVIGWRWGRMGNALIVFALVFSLSALFVYFNTDYLVGDGYQIFVRYGVMILVPLVAGVVVWVWPLSGHARSSRRLPAGLRATEE